MNITEVDSLDGYEALHYCEDTDTGLRALISIHSTQHGPAAGGCRLWNYASLEEAKTDVQRLSKGMTYKNRSAQLPLGGGKSVIIGEKKTPEMMRAFGRFVDALDGRYFTAEDVGISPSDMEIVAEVTPYVAGLEKGEYASGDPSPVTAKGVFACLARSVEYRLGRSDLTNVKVAVQGLGHVGWHLASYLHNAGAQLLVTDLNNDLVKKAVAEFGAVAIPLDEIYAVEADVFAPCALGAVLNEETVDQLKVSVVVGAANNQLSGPDIGDLLNSKDIFYAPDYVVNSGGIINVAAEILKCDDPSFVSSRIESLTQTLDKIIELAERENIGMHSAADQYVEAQLNKA
ncbi:Leu/Phe/Val dehydrogenase [Lentilitoribacter sp. EG35]|jgi:leucine dehydrogenase|uniref:Leu/Phe/Val dehydrogenase n=1 Tax=Lentilitoribacter sp. EG35 TaxID=3234192 RepID=UPI0034601E6F